MMEIQAMNYQIGDQVVHWNYGPGKIVGIDEKRLADLTRQYYVVEVNRLTLWVPADESGEKSLRRPTPSREFVELLQILSTPGEALPDNQYERQNQLIHRMQNKTLVDICAIVRDLNSWAHNHRLNRNDAAIMKRAEEFLLDEWELSLGTPRLEAQDELHELLKAEPVEKDRL